ncbi:hypothetical protein WR25_08935 [Diploscapter pachys]|uniref:Uncharacterized protein n=1 Tax=Diploscapter pachys TaxID=2018661 RepID=A0A2A2LSF3_9BILA|nr:hypothetical protein WR25_08935 [Diploscapter pachys]
MKIPLNGIILVWKRKYQMIILTIVGGVSPREEAVLGSEEIPEKSDSDGLQSLLYSPTILLGYDSTGSFQDGNQMDVVIS